MIPELEAAKLRWKAGEALEAGRAIFGKVPGSSRPGWAARVLRVAVTAAPEHAADIATVLAVADEPRRWREGHTAFDHVRRLVLKVDEGARRTGWTPKSPTHAHLLAIAELVAKVTYNATDPDGEFDEDSGWWLAVCVRNLVEHLGAPTSSRGPGWHCRMSRPLPNRRRPPPSSPTTPFSTRFRCDATSAIDLSPTELVEKLAAIVPPPRAHTMVYAGVLTGNAAWRSEVVPKVATVAARPI